MKHFADFLPKDVCQILRQINISNDIRYVMLIDFTAQCLVK